MNLEMSCRDIPVGLRLALVLALAPLLGCPTPESSECRSGFLCPPGTYCVESADDAAGAVQIECAPDSCGDGFVDDKLGEVCDDGNDDPDDGCHACQVAATVEAEECTSVKFTGHSYLFCAVLASWKDAAADCQERGHDLVTVDDATENLFLLQHTPEVPDAIEWWLGYFDFLNAGIFVSVDGDPPDFTNWVMEGPDSPGSSEPVCAELNPDGLWQRDSCQSLQPYICEKS